MLERVIALLLLVASFSASGQAGTTGVGLVQAWTDEGGRVNITVTAPAAFPLFLDNCNGAINWGLSRKGEKHMPTWLVERDACWTTPIRVAAGTSRTLRLGRPLGADRPAPGQYRVVLFGVYSSYELPAWPSSPKAGTPVPLVAVTSNPIWIMGQ